MTYAFLAPFIEDLYVLHSQPFITSFAKLRSSPSDTNLNITCIILLTFLFENYQRFDNTVHCRFQVGEEFIVNEIQALDKLFSKYEICVTQHQRSSYGLPPLVLTTDFVIPSLCVVSLDL